MNAPTVKLLILALLTLAAGSMTVMLSQSPFETDESFQPVLSDAVGEPLSEIPSLRSTAKCRIARDVIAGRFSLLQGAALFGALNQVLPRAPELSVLDLHDSPLSLWAHSEEELLCRQLVECVAWELVEKPDRAETAVARLEAEFKDALRRDGFIQLPNPHTLVPVEKLLEQARVELTDKGVLSPRRRTSRADGNGASTSRARRSVLKEGTYT